MAGRAKGAPSAAVAAASPSASCGESLRVVVRCRPLSRGEVASGAESVVSVEPRLGQVSLRHPRAAPGEPAKRFTFDAAFGPGARLREVYEEAARPLVAAVLAGVNGTLLCYGQTGTGKTYTLQGGPREEGAGAGPEEEEEEEGGRSPGLLGLAFEELFARIGRSAGQQRYLVRASYLEVYQEEVRDLLAGPPRRLELKESPERGVHLKDLASFVAKDARELRHVLAMGDRARAVGATNLNEHSSRSHAIVLVTVEGSQAGPDGQEHIRVGKLHLVDLAGSERQGKAGANSASANNANADPRPREASKINLSLSALGNVISALVDGRSTHVPYRDSKLTRLLQDSLGGNAKTVMVATLGPAAHSYEETLSTLRFASRAKRIKNKPRVNEDPKDTLLREFQEEIARLKAQLEKRGMLGKRRRRRRKKAAGSGGPGEQEEEDEEEEEEEDGLPEEPPGVEGRTPGERGQAEERAELLGGLEKNVEAYLKAQKERLEEEKAAIQDDHSLVGGEKETLLAEKERMLQDLHKEREATEHLAIKYKAMESKLLIGGRNIMDHTNEQQKMLELKRQEIAEQKRREREMQQQVLLRDEETMELRETFTSLQQEVEIKTKKLKKLYAKLQAVKAEIQDQHDEYIRVRQDLEEAQNEQTRELKLKYLIIENFIPPEEKNKIMNRLYFDCEEDQWKFQPLVLSVGSGGGGAISSTNTGTQMKKRPMSAVGYKRPISQYARLAMSMGPHPRYRAENIMFLELDISPPAIFEFEITCDQNEHDPRARHLERLMRLDSLLERPAASRVRKSRSWCQTPRSLPSSATHVSLASSSQNPSTATAHQ